MSDIPPVNSRLKIAVLSNLWPDALDQLQRLYECQVAINPASDVKKQVLEDAEIVIVRSPVVLDRSVLESATHLRLIVRAGTGLELIDTVFAKERGVRVVTVPLSADSVAEHALGLFLSLSRRIPWMHERLKQGRWEKHSGYGRELRGKTIGLIGFGRIGTRLAEISALFDMKVLACDRSPDKPAKRDAASRLGVNFVSLEEISSESDLISIQVPLTADTRGMIDTGIIRLMKKNTLVVNVGRGDVVDESALYNALINDQIAGAALDVFAVEPAGGNPLLTLHNFVATPHIGAQTVEAQRKVGEDVVRIVHAFAEDKEPDDFDSR